MIDTRSQFFERFPRTVVRSVIHNNQLKFETLERANPIDNLANRRTGDRLDADVIELIAGQIERRCAFPGRQCKQSADGQPRRQASRELGGCGDRGVVRAIHKVT